VTTTPWADNLAKRTAESQDLFPPQDKPLIRPDRRPKPSPIQLGRPTPTPTPQPITPPEPDATPFMDRMLQKAGATALDFITSQGQQTVNALGNLSEFALGSRNPLDVPGDIPRQAKHAFDETMLALDASQEAIDTVLGPELSSLLGEGLAWENIKRNPLLLGGAGRVISEIATEPKSFMEFLRSRPSEFLNRLEQNREAQVASEEVFSILIRGGMNPYEAGEALEANFQSRPMSTQIGTSVADPFMLPGAIRGGIRGARVLSREAPEIAANLRSLVNPEIAQAAGREPFEDVLEVLLKARNHGEARRIIEDADPSNLPALREAIDTMDPKLAAVHRAKVVLDMPLTPAEQIRADQAALSRAVDRPRRGSGQPKPVTPQVPALEGMTPLGLADEPPLVAPGTTVQPDLGGELAGAGGPRQVSMLDLGTGARAEQVPLIDEAEIVTQAAERARLAEEAAAGQQGLGLEVARLPGEGEARQGPITVYTGADEPFTEFDVGRIGQRAGASGKPLSDPGFFGRGAYTTTDYEKASRWSYGSGNVMATIIPTNARFLRVAGVSELYDKWGLRALTEKEIDAAQTLRDPQGRPTVASQAAYKETIDTWTDKMIKEGYDGVEYAVPGGDNQFILFHPEKYQFEPTLLGGPLPSPQITPQVPSLEGSTPLGITPDIAGVAPTTPIRFDPARNNYNVPLQRGDLLTDESGNIYRLERQSGFILEVDAQRPNGSFAPFGSFSVDPGDVDRYRPLFKEISPTGITPERQFILGERPPVVGSIIRSPNVEGGADLTTIPGHTMLDDGTINIFVQKPDGTDTWVHMDETFQIKGEKMVAPEGAPPTAFELMWFLQRLSRIFQHLDVHASHVRSSQPAPKLN
jgi:hypothetical protein